MTTAMLVLVIVVLIFLQGFFSGAEMALVNCDKTKLRHKAKQGDESSRLALKLLDRPEVILSTTLIGTNISLVAVSVVGTTLMFGHFGDPGDLYAVLLLTPVVLIFAEVVPKSVYQQRANELTPRIIYPIYAFYLLLYPVVFVFARTARLIAHLVGGGRPSADMFAVREQMQAVLETAEGATTRDVFDRARIGNVIRFGSLSVGDVMLPAGDMTALDAGGSVAQAVELLRQTGEPHIPVYEGRRSNIIGMVSLTVWDLMGKSLQEQNLKDFSRNARFVPEKQPLAEVLPILRQREDESAIVVDEYGTAIGMITVGLILEVVVGKVDVGRAYEQRVARGKPRYKKLGEDRYLMDGRMPIADVNEVLGTHIKTAEAHTLGGLLVVRLRHLPKPGERLVEAGFIFEVEDVSERAVKKLRVERA